MRVHTTYEIELRHVPCIIRKQNTVENFNNANFMSNYVTPSMDKSVQRLPQQAHGKHKQ